MAIEDAKSPRRQVSSFPALSLLLALASAAFVIGLLMSGHRLSGLQRLENATADVRTALHSSRVSADHPEIVLVTITDDTLPLFAMRSPVDRGFLADLVQAVDASQPRAIGLDIAFLAPSDAIKDRNLQQSLREARARIVLADFDDRSRYSNAQRAFHEQFVAASGRQSGYAALQYDADGVVRNNAPPAGAKSNPDSFALLLARSMTRSAMAGYGRIAWLQKVDDGNFLTRIYNADAASPFRTVRAEDLVDPARRIRVGGLGGKIVLIGTRFSSSETHRTPLTRWSGIEPSSTEIHAQSVAQLLDGRTLPELRSELSRLWLLSLAVIGGLIAFRGRHRASNIARWFVIGLMIVAVDALVFSHLQLIMPLASMLLAWCAGILCGRSIGHVYDYELENAKRWDLPAV